MVLPYISVNQSQGYICPHHPELPSHLPPYPIPLGCPRALTLCALPHASNLHGLSILHVFQCLSLKLSHPRLLPRPPRVCSLHLSPLLPCL